tara:strand:- start:1028 stop:1408 length:381 start_codon:yes stop_codon:yes gene_type:complete
MLQGYSMSRPEQFTDGSKVVGSKESEPEEEQGIIDLQLKSLRALSTSVDDQGRTQIVAYLTKQDVCEIMSLTPRTIERWVEQGILPAYKMGTHQQSPIRFKIEDVDQLLLSRLRESKKKDPTPAIQ